MTRPRLERTTLSLLALPALLFSVAAAAAAACSENSASSVGSPSAQAVCPASPEETIGAACTVSGLRCGPQYTCGIVQVSLLCVCTGGAFQCSDGTGRQLESGAQPMCPPSSALGSCPSTEKGAQLAGCGDQGLLCSYPSPCSSSLDECQCFPGTTADGGFGLRFECLPAPCVGAAPMTIDSGDSSPVADASSPFDSTMEAEADAGADDSHEDAAADGIGTDGFAGDG